MYLERTAGSARRPTCISLCWQSLRTLEHYEYEAKSVTHGKTSVKTVANDFSDVLGRHELHQLVLYSFTRVEVRTF